MTPTFVLGLDGATPRLLDRFSLPNLERIAEAGVEGTMRSSLPPITFPAWKCITTGRNPGKLGAFGFCNFDRESRENVTNDSTSFTGGEIWDYVSEKGGSRGRRQRADHVPAE